MQTDYLVFTLRPLLRRVPIAPALPVRGTGDRHPADAGRRRCSVQQPVLAIGTAQGIRPALPISSGWEVARDRGKAGAISLLAGGSAKRRRDRRPRGHRWLVRSLDWLGAKDAELGTASGRVGVRSWVRALRGLRRRPRRKRRWLAQPFELCSSRASTQHALAGHGGAVESSHRVAASGPRTCSVRSRLG